MGNGVSISPSKLPPSREERRPENAKELLEEQTRREGAVALSLNRRIKQTLNPSFETATRNETL